MSDRAIEQSAPCVCLRAGEPFVGKQGFTYAAAVSAETAGATAIRRSHCPRPRPGGRAKAHKHKAHETALYVLSGKVGMYYGEARDHMAKPEQLYLYIQNTPHLPYNMTRPNRRLRAFRAPTPTSRKASCCCRAGRDPPVRRRLPMRWT